MRWVHENERFNYEGLRKTIELDIGCARAVRERRNAGGKGRRGMSKECRAASESWLRSWKIDPKMGGSEKLSRDLGGEIKNVGFGTGSMGDYCAEGCQPIWDTVECGRN